MPPVLSLPRRWELSFQLPAATTDRTEFIFFAPSRTSITSVNVRGTDAAFEPVAFGPRRIWVIRRTAGSPASDGIDVVGVGDRPGVLSATAFLPTGGDRIVPPGSAEANALSAAAAAMYDEFEAEMLNARATLLDHLGSPPHVLFARFDAWTTPVLRDWLETCAPALGRRARHYFIEKMPVRTWQADVPVVTLLTSGLAAFVQVPALRGLGWQRRTPYGEDLKIEAGLRAWLCEVGWSEVDLVHALASYQFEIFRQTYPSQQLPGAELERAFALFAMGRLRTDATTSETWLNFEPDSPQFFVFAEFCWQAARVAAPPSVEYWSRLAYVFAALQEVYRDHYRNVAGGWHFSDYDPVFYHKGTYSLAGVRALVRRYARDYSDAAALLDRMALNAFETFRDDYP